MLRASVSIAALVAAGSAVTASPIDITPPAPNRISRRAAASIPQTVGDYTYKGCYSDLVAGGARVLSLSLPNGAHTVEGCIAAAKAGGYSLAGIEYYGECWVGNELDSRSTVQGDAACNLVCWGDSTEFCGGQGGSTGATMQLYSLPSSSSTSTSTTTTTTSTTTTSAAATATPTFVKSYTSGSKDWTRQSCQSDLRYGTRALPNQLAQLKSRTVEGCLDACTSAGYSLCGVEWDGECWGANSLDPTSITLDDSACNKVCADDVTEICGGTGGESGSAFQLFKAVTASTSTSTTSTAAATATGLTGLKVGGSVVQGLNSTAGPTWSNNGCYGDLKYGTRALSHLFAQETNGTVEACVNACQEAGYSLCGVEYQGECWGGDSIDSTSSEIDASVCNLACSGDNSQRCGGSQAAGTPGIAPFGASFQLYAQCGDNVATCNLESATSCWPPHVLYDGACDDTVCPDGWYNDNYVCKPCNSVDETCTSLTNATRCIKGHVLFEAACARTTCPDGYYDDGNRVCQSCAPQHAATCSSATIAKTCVPGWFLKGQQCVQDCGAGYFDGVCQRCREGLAATCDSTGTSLTCVSGALYWSSQRTCVSSCPYYPTSTTLATRPVGNQCVECGTGMLTCQGIGAPYNTPAGHPSRCYQQAGQPILYYDFPWNDSKCITADACIAEFGKKAWLSAEEVEAGFQTYVCRSCPNKLSSDRKTCTPSPL